MTGWVRAAHAAKMLGVSRERVAQLIAVGTLKSKRKSPRQVWVSVESVEARLASPWHRNGAGVLQGG